MSVVSSADCYLPLIEADMFQKHPQHSAQHSLKEEKKVEAKLMEKKPIIWTYNKVLILMQILRAWIERDVPASQMGIFLVEILYQTDRHMNSRVTRLVECNETYENIAKSVAEYFQIRDEWHQPLWTKLISGDPDLRPGLEFIHESTIEELSCSALLQKYAGNVLFAPKPLRYVHWPFFPSKEELRTTLSGKDSEDDDLNELNSHTDGDIPCYGAVKTRTPALSQTGPHVVSMTAEIIRPEENQIV